MATGSGSASQPRAPAGAWPARRLRLLALALLAAAPGTGFAQDTVTTSTLRDTLVMRLVAFRAPCPVPAPAAWSMIDSTLGSGLRCSLVQAAATVLAERLGSRPRTATLDGDPWHPMCVRLVEARNMGSTGLPGDWLVLFDLAPQLSAEVLVDRQSGAVAAVRIVGDAPRMGPPCAAA